MYLLHNKCIAPSDGLGETWLELALRFKQSLKRQSEKQKKGKASAESSRQP